MMYMLSGTYRNSRNDPQLIRSMRLAKSDRPAACVVQVLPQVLDRVTRRWSQHRYTRSPYCCRASTEGYTTVALVALAGLVSLTKAR
jgi:hypothetical protein